VLDFSLFEAREVPFDIPQYVQSVFHSSLLTAKSVNSVVACDGFLWKIFCIFCTGYFDYTVTFQIVSDSCWLVSG